MWFKNKSKIFKILSLSLFTFPNLVFVGNFTKRNPISFYAKNDLINQNLSKHNQEQLQTINDWTSKFPWLEKYASDENFTNRNFNAYINQGLIENAIKDYYFLQLILSFESFISNDYPCLKYRYFRSSANDCKLKNAMDQLYDDTSTDWVTSCMSLANKSSSAFVDIIFDQDYFEQLNKTYWNYYFDIDKCEFNFNNSSDINPLVEDIRSCLFANEKSNGIYYIEEKDKDNKNNPINLEIRDKIKKIKDIKNTYCKEKLLFFCDTIKELRNCDFSRLTPSHIKKINELMLFLCEIASTNRELLDYSAIAKEKHEEKFAQSAFTSLIRQELSNWVKNYFNASIIPKEFLPFLAHNKFDDFLNYIYCYRKKYVCKGVTNFKNAIDDFIPIAVHNHKLIAWEKAIASFILTILNKKKTTCLSWFAPFTDGESFEHFAAEYFQWSIDRINFLVLDGWWWYLGLGAWFSSLTGALNIGNGIAKKIIKKICDLGFKKITDAFNERIVNTLRRNSSAKNLRSLQRTIANVSKKGIMNATENNSGLLKLNKMHIEKEIANTTDNIINDFNNEVINGEQIINNQEMKNCQVNNSEAISLATGEILRFFGHHYPTIEKCGQIFLINTYYFPEESYRLLPPNTTSTNSTLVENILRYRLKRQCESREINLSDDEIATIISYCLRNYFKRPRINVRTINMDEIVHIPWSYGEDKGDLDEVDKFMNSYTIGCENKWLIDSFYWSRNKKCIDDTKNKITGILDLNKDNLIPVYYFNSNFWIHSKHVPKEVSQWIPINMIGEGFIPFKWLILSILKILKNNKNPLSINYLIKTIFSFFKIENTDKEIASHILPIIKRIFREPTLQIHEKNNNFFCLKSSLPKKIIEDIKKWERITSTPTYSIFVNGQEYVSSSTIISSIVDMLISKKSIFTLQRAFLQKIVEFYFKQSIISYKNNIAKKQDISANNTRQISINRSEVKNINKEKKVEDNEPILPDRSNIIQNKENIPAYDNLISENGYNINNIAQNEEKREEENDINDNELEEYVKNSVNKLLNNARFTINRQIGFEMLEIKHDIIEYLFIGDSLSKELKDQIKKENESIRDFNANKISMKMDEIDVNTVDYDRVVSLIMKLLSSKNEEVSNKIKHNNNYRFKLLETIKNIVLKLIKNSRKLSDDTYKIVINENVYDFVQEKKDEKNNIIQNMENSVKNEKVGEKNDDFNDKKQVQVHRVDNDKDNKPYYTKLDYFNAIEIYKKFKKHSIFATKKDSLRIAYKERKDKEKISDSYKNLLFNWTFHNYIKQLLKETDISSDIDGLHFRFDSLPMLIKQKLESDKNLFPSAIRWDSLITEITKIVEKRVKCHIGDNFIKICLTEILNSKSWHSLVYKKDINIQKANTDAINKDIKKRIEAINNYEDDTNGIYYSLINNDGYDAIASHNIWKHVEKEINIDEIVKSIKKEYLQNNATEKIDLTKTKEIIKIICDIFKENSPIIKFFNSYPNYNKYDNSDDKIGCSVAFFSTEHLPKTIQNNLKPKVVNSWIVAKKITELIEQKNNGEEKYTWFKHFKDAIAKDEIITDVLDVLYNQKLQISDEIVAFIMQSLAHIDVMKWSDVSTQNTDYWVNVDSLSNKEQLIPFNFNFDEKYMIEIKNQKYIQFDVLVDRIIVALWNLYSFPMQKDNKPNLPHNVWFIGGERISLNKASEADKISKKFLVTNRVKYICHILLWMFEQKHINEDRHFEKDPNLDGGYKSFGKSFSFGLWNEDNFWSSYLKNKESHKNDDFFSYIFSLYNREQEK